MVFIMQTMWIGKMCILTAKFFGFFIHHRNKIFNGAPYMLCNRICTLICRRKHNRIETLFHRHLFAIVPCNTGSFRIIDRGI